MIRYLFCKSIYLKLRGRTETQTDVFGCDLHNNLKNGILKTVEEVRKDKDLPSFWYEKNIATVENHSFRIFFNVSCPCMPRIIWLLNADRTARMIMRSEELIQTAEFQVQ
jgi:hypothetical protein